MKTITIQCDFCGKEFERQLKEYNRQQVKRGRPAYCSQGCATKKCHEKGSYKNNIWTSETAPRDLGGTKKDEFSPYRETLRRVKRRRGKHNFDIDLHYIKEVYEAQEGKCIYTGVDIELPDGKKSNATKTASLDRIDSKKGYVKGNVQFISVICNHAKNDLTHEEMIEWIESLKR